MLLHSQALKELLLARPVAVGPAGPQIMSALSLATASPLARGRAMAREGEGGELEGGTDQRRVDRICLGKGASGGGMSVREGSELAASWGMCAVCKVAL